VPPADRVALLGAERSRLDLPLHGSVRVGVGYPGSYHVAHSSLAFQWVVELTARIPDVAVERFVADPGLAGATLDSGTPLGNLDVLAFSCSFEPEAVELLRILDAAGIPRRRGDRGPRHPLVVVGGPLATLNPLPLAPAVDVFCLGAAEALWPPLLTLASGGLGRGAFLQELAQRDGYLVPEHHLDGGGRPLRRLRQVQRHDLESAAADAIPASHRVTPHTEYRQRALVEISRGCPERCRYCWISHNEGRLACYGREALEQRVDQLARLTSRIGLVATAVGDHPDLPHLLGRCVDRGLDVAVSSLRVPAVAPAVLEPLVASGARSVTIAPEAGSDRLRTLLGKRVTNADVLRAVADAAACGIENVKMYFIVGLPDETDADLEAVARLALEVREILLDAGRRRGRLGELRLAVNPLVPKPYTPYHREGILPATEYRRRVDVIASTLRGVANVRLDRSSHREALWQGYLARAGVRAFELLVRLADGEPLGRLLAGNRKAIDAVTSAQVGSPTPWHFVTKAPAV